jgi:hypothetical protein
MSRQLSLTLLVMTALTVSPAAWSMSLEVEARYWAPGLNGELEVQERGTGTRIDLTSDLGIDDSEFLEGRLTWRITRQIKLRAAFLPLSYSGSSDLVRTIEFAGQSFQINTRLLSDLELDYGRLGLAWQFISGPSGAFRLGPMVEAKGLRGDAQLSVPDFILPLSASEEFEGAFASAGLALDLEPSEQLHVFAEATVSIDTAEGDFTEAEVGIRYRPTETLGVTGGYRIIDIRVDDGDEFLEIDIEGVFLGLELRF